MTDDGRLGSLIASTTSNIVSQIQAYGVPVSAGLRERIRHTVAISARCARLVGRLHPDGGSAPDSYAVQSWDDEPTRPGHGPPGPKLPPVRKPL